MNKHEASYQKAPLVSVLIPLYNHANYIEECLESVKSEGYPNIELIIHDDVSPDASYEIASKWVTDNREHFANILIEQAPKNRGVIGALNRLVSLANGDFIVCPLASDDALLPGGIQARLNYLIEHPKYLAVFSDAHAVDDDGKLMNVSTLDGHYKSEKKLLRNPPTRRMEMLHRWSVPGPVIMYRKESFDPTIGVGLYNETLCLEDRDMYLRLLERDALGFLDIPVSRYRLHANNTMTDPSQKDARIDALVGPLHKISKSKNLNILERFVAKHTAIGIQTKHQGDEARNKLRKYSKRLIAYIHKRPARTLAKIYCAFLYSFKRTPDAR